MRNGVSEAVHGDGVVKSIRRILVVDDDPVVLRVLYDMVSSFGYGVEAAQDGFEALAKIRLDVDLVMLDLVMPGLGGYEVIRRVRREPDVGDIPIVMVTSLGMREERIRAIEAGANDFITKPVDITELKVRLASLLKMKENQDLIKRHQAELEHKVDQRTKDLRVALEEMARAQRRTYEAHLDTIHRLVVAAEYKDEDTAAHIKRMSQYSAIIAKGFGLPPDEMDILLHASSMHDVGKIGIPDSVLLKPAKLDPPEWEKMKEHTVIGSRILAGSNSDLLQMGEIIALTHHERWDGTGYPKGLKGKEIPVYGRICAVADVFDALTSKRPYKRQLENEEAYRILEEGRGTHFDPRVLDMFFGQLGLILESQKQDSLMPAKREPAESDPRGFGLSRALHPPSGNSVP